MKKLKRIFKMGILLRIMLLAPIQGVAQEPTVGPAGSPYSNMPLIAPIGERIEKHIDVPESAEGYQEHNQ